jgi:hypothetical protein
MTNRSDTDLARSGIAVRLLSSMGMLAHSVAVQAVATVAVTVALATVPWLPHVSAPLPQVASVSPQNGPQAGGAQVAPLDPFTLSGIPPLGAFPMEGEAHFTTSLSRPFVALAGAEWRDDGPATLSQQASPSAKRKKPAAQGCEDCEEPALLQQAAFVLPPPRPADLADGAIPRRAPAVPAQASAATPATTPAPAAKLADLGWPSLPALPSLPPLPGVEQVASGLDQARDAVTRTLSAATGVFKAY